MTKSRRGWWGACWAAALLLGLGGALPALAEDGAEEELSYRLGEGLHLPGTGLTLGGYATASAEKLRQTPGRLAAENVSLFVWWEGEGRWKFFSELDYENLASSRRAERDDDKRYLALERLYFDYALGDADSVRFGKFLTPIGRWNLSHATPLVWTSSRPLVTIRTFPTNVTGVMASGTVAPLGDAEYAVYASAGHEIRANPNLDPFSDAVGGHLAFALSANAQLGFSYANFEQQKSRGERKQLVGFDYRWAHRGYEVSAEGVYRQTTDTRRSDEKGAFLQVVIPIAERLHAVGRYEVYRQEGAQATTQVWVTGLNYHYTPAVVFKAEWVGMRHNPLDAPEGFMSSVSILF